MFRQLPVPTLLKAPRISKAVHTRQEQDRSKSRWDNYGGEEDEE